MTATAPTLGEALTGLDPGELLAAATTLAGAAEALAAAADRSQGQVARLSGAGSWSGAARDGFLDVWVRRRANFDALSAAWRDAAVVLRGLAWSLDSARRQWRQAAADTQRLGLALSPSGQVVSAATGLAPSLAELPDTSATPPPVGEVLAIQARADRALAQAAEADRAAAAGLRQWASSVHVPPAVNAAATAGLLHAALRGGVLAAGGAGVAGLAPGLVAAWWAALPARRRGDLLAGQPARLGGLDGIPPGVRDRANRAVLASERERLAQHRAAIDRRLATTGIGPRHQRLLDERALLDRRAATLDRLAATDGLLLLFDPAGDGRAAVALGDPTRAANVTVVVPGMDNRLDNFGNPLGNARSLHTEIVDLYQDQPRATRLAHETAVIAWLGYDTPNPAQVADDRLAREGAPALRQFVDGLRTTHTGDPHVTVSAHSFGSTVTGFAARDGRLAADDLAIIGSPGLGQGITTLDELHLDPSTTMWAARAPDDPIQFVQLSDAPRQALEAVVPDGFTPLDEPWVRHGSDPSRLEFGAHTFSTGDAHGHSAYYKDRTSLRNLAYIAAGDPGLVQQAQGKTP